MPKYKVPVTIYWQIASHHGYAVEAENEAEAIEKAHELALNQEPPELYEPGEEGVSYIEHTVHEEDIEPGSGSPG